MNLAMMTAPFVLALLSTQSPPPVGVLAPQTVEAAAVMAPVDAVFSALAARDADQLRPHVDATGKLTVVISQADGPSRVIAPTWAQFFDNLEPGPERFEEVMVDPVIAVDGDVAMVWGEYIFRIDGAVSHCGVDHFDLVRRDNVWKIVNLTWTQRTTGCEAIAARLDGQAER